MTSSRWHAHGNVYLVAETGEYVMDPELDGVMQILEIDGDDVTVAIVNPDGSLAEMSGNGTRIAARWLAERTGAEQVSVQVGEREVQATMLGGQLVEQDLGTFKVGRPELVDGIRLTTVDVGNPHAVVDGDPADLPRIGPLLETHLRFPQRTNVQVARRAGDELEARVWERGVGETASSGSSAVAIAAAFGAEAVTVRFPGGPLDVRLADGRAFLTGPAERSD